MILLIANAVALTVLALSAIVMNLPGRTTAPKRQTPRPAPQWAGPETPQSHPKPTHRRGRMTTNLPTLLVSVAVTAAALTMAVGRVSNVLAAGRRAAVRPAVSATDFESAALEEDLAAVGNELGDEDVDGLDIRYCGQCLAPVSCAVHADGTRTCWGCNTPSQDVPAASGQ